MALQRGSLWVAHELQSEANIQAPLMINGSHCFQLPSFDIQDQIIDTALHVNLLLLRSEMCAIPVNHGTVLGATDFNSTECNCILIDMGGSYSSYQELVIYGCIP